MSGEVAAERFRMSAAFFATDVTTSCETVATGTRADDRRRKMGGVRKPMRLQEAA